MPPRGTVDAGRLAQESVWRPVKQVGRAAVQAAKKLLLRTGSSSLKTPTAEVARTAADALADRTPALAVLPLVVKAVVVRGRTAVPGAGPKAPAGREPLPSTSGGVRVGAARPVASLAAVASPSPLLIDGLGVACSSAASRTSLRKGPAASGTAALGPQASLAAPARARTRAGFVVSAGEEPPKGVQAA